MLLLAKHSCAAQEQASRDQHQKRESTGQMVPLNQGVALKSAWPGSGRVILDLLRHMMHNYSECLDRDFVKTQGRF